MRRTSIRLFASIVLLGSLVCAGGALAWPTDPTQNVAIAKGPGEQEGYSMAPDGAGGMLVAWADSSNQFTRWNIRVSHLRANGTLDPSWPAGGVEVCNATGEQRYAALVSDGAGGAIVTWSDYRSGTNWDIYAHHVLASGVVDFGWPANGAPVCFMPGDQIAFDPQIVSDGAGGAILAWSDFRDNDWDVYANHITPIGMDPAWGNQGRPVCTVPGQQGVSTVVSDESGGVIVAWNDARNGISTDDVYAMRVLANGALASGWTVNGVAVSAATGIQRHAVGVPDGQHGAILAWQDTRSGNSDIYFHRVLAAGGLAAAIPADGSALCVQPGLQARPKVVSDGAGGAIVEWHDQRDGVNSAVYVHHAMATGPDAGWPANGRAVRVETGEWFPGVVSVRGFVSDGAGGAIVAWQDHRNGLADVYAMRVLPAGTLDPAWPAGGRAVSTAAGDQGGPGAFAAGSGRTIVAWFDRRNDEGWDVYAQALSLSGELGVATLASGVTIPSLQRGSLDWGDYDADGDLDLLMTGTDLASPRCYLLRNDGGGTFTEVAAGLPGIEWSSAEWGDFDADGDLDIAMAGWNGTPGIARIYRNDGMFGWTDIAADLPGVTYASVAWGDLDRDGDLDLLLAGLDNSNVRIARVYRNSGGGFTDAALGLTGVAGGDADWGDFDGDGDFDLLLSGGASSGALTRVYMAHPGGLFALDLGLPGVEAMDGSLAWGDYDNDGDLDILLSGWDGATRHLAIFRNDAGTFADIDANLAGLSSGAVAWGDCDNDGDLDVLASGYGDVGGGLSRIYRNDSGTFVDAHAGLPNLFYSAVAWADWDGDGDLDPVISGAPDFFSANTTILRTEFATPNTPPTAPTNLSAVRYGSFVTFSWTPSTDAQTPAAGLSYNLRVSMPGGPDWPVTSMSRANGFRKVVRLGNAGQGSFGLQLGDQVTSWTVQAIDGAFAGSPFANESSLLVDVADGPLAAVPGMRAPSPNPFRADTRLAWTLAKAGSVELAIYDPSGRRVRMLERGARTAGPGSATWDGRDDSGRRLAPGLYFVRLEAGTAWWWSKVVLAR